MRFFSEFSSFILGDDDVYETEGQDSPHKLRNMLMKRIDNLSDLVSSFRFNESLLNNDRKLQI